MTVRFGTYVSTALRLRGGCRGTESDTGPLIRAEALTASRLAARARPTSGLGATRQMNPRNKFLAEIWKLALKAFSSSMLVEVLGGQMSTVPEKGDTVMVRGQSAKGRLLLRAPSK